jgi:hypothetical protein
MQPADRFLNHTPKPALHSRTSPERFPGTERLVIRRFRPPRLVLAATG